MHIKQAKSREELTIFRLTSCASDADARIYSTEDTAALLAGWRESCSPLYSQEVNCRFPQDMFFAVEFVIWLMTNVAELSTKQAAVDFANILVKSDVIRMLPTGQHFCMCPR